ncbi:hypothetical protein D3C87_526280 [compost metagenome]
MQKQALKSQCVRVVLEKAVCLDIFQKDNFIVRLRKMDKDKNYHFYCRSSQCSAMPARSWVIWASKYF